MRRPSVWLVAVIVSLVPLVGTMASAHCGDDAGEKAHDPYGSCETANGNLRCGDQHDEIGGIIISSAPSSGSGLQVCNDAEDVPVWGRVTVHSGSDGVMVGADSDKDTQGANGWVRVDVGMDGCVRARSGSGNGSYYTSSGGTSNPDQADQTACA